MIDSSSKTPTPEDSDSQQPADPDSLSPDSIRNPDMIRRMHETVDKFAVDNASRGDLKLVDSAMRELRYGFKVFRPFRAQRKVSIFGSARTLPDQPAYKQAVKFSGEMVDRHWYVITGASSGIMEAGHLGAGREKSMGLNILLPFEANSNAVIEGDPKLVHMKYFFTRKLLFVKESDAVVCLPGGFGTLDEGLEVLTLLQTGKRAPCPVILLDAPGGTYWKRFHEFVSAELHDGGMISTEDFHLYKVTDSCQEAVDECVNFYKVYDSMRYVGDTLVFRLKSKPSDELVAQLNEHFADLLTEGEFEVREAFPQESNEQAVYHLPRLAFSFNRRNLGRLRLLIDCINAGRVENVPSA